MKTAIYMLFMEEEFEVTTTPLTNLYPQLDQTTQLFLLLNGSANQEIIDSLQGIPFVQSFACERNQGVAAGRNFLIPRAEVWGRMS